MKQCRWCQRTDAETKFQPSKFDICSSCRQGNVPTEEVKNSNAYYIYEHWSLQNNDVIYVGSGTDQRAWWNWGSGARDNPHHARYMFEAQAAKQPPHLLIRVVKWGMTKAKAEYEEELHKKHCIENGYTLKFCKDLGNIDNKILKKKEQYEAML